MKRIRYLLLAVAVMTATGCATVQAIKENPEYFVDKEVFFCGKIANKYPLPFTDYAVYNVNDGTDTILVFAESTYKPEDIIIERARVIGITESSSRKAAAELTAKVREFLVEKGITDAATAAGLSKTVVKITSSFGKAVEGSYFLMAE